MHPATDDNRRSGRYAPYGHKRGGRRVRLKSVQGDLAGTRAGQEEKHIWTPISEDQTILSRVPNVMVVRGAQGLYEAHKAGTTTLTATVDPQCRTAQPACATPSILFKVIVVVQ